LGVIITISIRRQPPITANVRDLTQLLAGKTFECAGRKQNPAESVTNQESKRDPWGL
jgi:hypothetical protein